MLIALKPLFRSNLHVYWYNDIQLTLVISNTDKPNTILSKTNYRGMFVQIAFPLVSLLSLL